jgi:hypothetical protein
MANHAGKDGIVKIGTNIVAEIKEWSIEESATFEDTTSMPNTSGYKTFTHTFSEWNGTLTCMWDETDTDGQGACTIGASVNLRVYPEGDATGDKYYSGTALISGITRTGAVDGMVTATFSFKGSGALTLATAT